MLLHTSLLFLHNHHASKWRYKNATCAPDARAGAILDCRLEGQYSAATPYTTSPNSGRVRLSKGMLQRHFPLRLRHKIDPDLASGAEDAFA